MKFLLSILMLITLLSCPVNAGEKSTIVSGADPGKPRPTIIFLHGKGGNGLQMQRQIDMDKTLGELGVVSIYPSGQNAQWRVGKFLSLRNDVDYLDTMIDFYIAKKVIDPKRLYIAGISNGGMMVQKMICASRYNFTGAAVVMATHPDVKNCKTPKPTPLMIFWGSEDKFFPRDGVEPNDWAKRMKFTSRKDTINFWRGVNGCPRDVLPVPSPDGKVDMRAYPGCAVPFAVYDLIGVGHAWPGAKRSPRMGDDPARNPGTVKIDEVLIGAWGLK